MFCISIAAVDGIAHNYFRFKTSEALLTQRWTRNSGAPSYIRRTL